MDSRNFFSPGTEDLHRNQFGGAFGGPILKDRLWFFGNYEGLRQIEDLTASAFVPTAAMFEGDFSAVPRTIYDPTTFSAETGTRTAFTSNVIPTQRINPVSSALLKYYLPGSSLSQAQNLFAYPGDTLDGDQFGIRVDASLSPRQSLFVQALQVDSNLVNEGIFPLSGTLYPEHTRLVMLQHTYMLRPNLVATFRLGGSRSYSRDDNQGSTSGPTGTDLGIPNRLGAQGVTRIGFSDYTGFGNATAGVGNGDNVYQLDGGINYIRGTHNLQAGVSLRYYRTWQQNANANGLGSLTFQRTYTSQLQSNGQGGFSSVTNTGDTFADFLLGMPASGTLTGLPSIPYRFTQFMPYIQDSWKVTRSLTLNYGVSWFKATEPNPQGQYHQWVHGFDYSNGLLTYASLGQVNSEVVPPDNLDFTPRIGFAWQPHFLPHTVIRAGAGIYYGDLQLGVLQFALEAPPYSNPVTFTNTEPMAQNTFGNNIFPPFTVATPTQDYAASLSHVGAFLLNPDAHYPYMQQWNFAVQHAFSDKDMVELVYTGNSDHRIENRIDYDACRPGSNLYCNPATRPYPNYTDLLTIGNGGISTYEALMARYEHRLSAGLNGRFEYTYGKGLSNNSDNGDAQIASCIACEKGPAGYDVRNRAVLSMIYDVPVGKGRHFGSAMGKAEDLAVGGWTATVITTFHSGLPFTVTSPNNSGSPYTTQEPLRVCNGSQSALADNLRTDGKVQFQTSCFVAPAAQFFGNSGHNILHGPGLNNFDIGVQKYFSISESVKLQFRTEMFNAFNHAQFGNPGTVVGSPTFGVVTTANSPRNIQLAMRLLF